MSNNNHNALKDSVSLSPTGVINSVLVSFQFNRAVKLTDNRSDDDDDGDAKIRDMVDIIITPTCHANRLSTATGYSS